MKKFPKNLNQKYQHSSKRLELFQNSKDQESQAKALLEMSRFGTSVFWLVKFLLAYKEAALVFHEYVQLLFAGQTHTFSIHLHVFKAKCLTLPQHQCVFRPECDSIYVNGQNNNPWQQRLQLSLGYWQTWLMTDMYRTLTSWQVIKWAALPQNKYLMSVFSSLTQPL